MSSSPDPLARLVAFGHALRDEGLAVGTGALVDFARAAALLSPGDVYWAGRATLAPGPAQIERYDRVFQAFFGAGAPPRAPATPRSPLGAGGLAATGGEGREAETGTAF